MLGNVKLYFIMELTDELIWSELLSSEPWPVADALLEGVFEPVSESPFLLLLLSSLHRFFNNLSLPLSLYLQNQKLFQKLKYNSIQFQFITHWFHTNHIYSGFSLQILPSLLREIWKLFIEKFNQVGLIWLK